MEAKMYQINPSSSTSLKSSYDNKISKEFELRVPQLPNDLHGMKNFISTTPVHLSFTRSDNVDLRTMRMPNQPSLAGYNPFRGDFKVEYDDNAEQLVILASHLHDIVNLEKRNITKQSTQSNKLLIQLQIVLVECYNSRLKERQRRKKIIKNYGLINRKGLHQCYTKLEVRFMIIVYLT